jgi:hypothetical protein
MSDAERQRRRRALKAQAEAEAYRDTERVTNQEGNQAYRDTARVTNHDDPRDGLIQTLRLRIKWLEQALADALEKKGFDDGTRRMIAEAIDPATRPKLSDTRIGWALEAWNVLSSGGWSATYANALKRLHTEET